MESMIRIEKQTSEISSQHCQTDGKSCISFLTCCNQCLKAEDSTPPCQEYAFKGWSEARIKMAWIWGDPKADFDPSSNIFVSWDNEEDFTSKFRDLGLLEGVEDFTVMCEVPTNVDELRKQARAGKWVGNVARRRLAYGLALLALPCSADIPDADFYRQMPSQYKQHEGKLPDFVASCPFPNYWLTKAGEDAVFRVLWALSYQFPGVTHCPRLPVLASLLFHFAPSEAAVFSALSRLLSCDDSDRIGLARSRLEATGLFLTLADLAKRWVPRATLPNRPCAYGLSWILVELPFHHALRVLDCLLVEGDKVMFRVALALLKLDVFWPTEAVSNVGTAIPAVKFENPESGPIGISQEKKEDVKVTSEACESENVAQELMSKAQDQPENQDCDCRNFPMAEELMRVAFSLRMFSRREIRQLQCANEQELYKGGIMPQCRGRIMIPLDTTTFDSDVVTAEEMCELWTKIPERHSLHPPNLIFSIASHGSSLSRFYSCCAGQQPTLLVLKTTDDEVFGAFLSTDWRERTGCNIKWAGPNFFGTGECFVFMVRPMMECFQWAFLQKPKQHLSSEDLQPFCGSPANSLLTSSSLSMSEKCLASSSPSSSPPHSRRGSFKSLFSSLLPEQNLSHSLSAQSSSFVNAISSLTMALSFTGPTSQSSLQSYRRFSTSGASPPLVRRNHTTSLSEAVDFPSCRSSLQTNITTTRKQVVAEKDASMFMAGTAEGIYIGGGGEGFALSLDCDLLHGCSVRCNTFANSPLSSTGHFRVTSLEVWTPGINQTL
uniref:TBC1 domain family member 24-like n=1 Tax=Myxine glutinosa TaxID=7769 RepID=UPI00358E468D